MVVTSLVVGLGKLSVPAFVHHGVVKKTLESMVGAMDAGIKGDMMPYLTGGFRSKLEMERKGNCDAKQAISAYSLDCFGRTFGLVAPGDAGQYTAGSAIIPMTLCLCGPHFWFQI